MENDTVSLWNKQTTDLTVGDSVKYAVGVTVITTAATFAVFAIAGGAVRLAEKFSERKAKKSEAKTQEG